MTQHLHHLIDQLLLEQGEYVPLEFLLQEGRLSYSDYEAWRHAELDLLEQALFGDPAQIQKQLAQAEEYLQRRGWQAETISYQSWVHPHSQPDSQPLPPSVAKPLSFSANNTLDRCFHRCYRKPQDQPQLDLFSDSPATNIVNGITQALSGRNPGEARRQLERLYETEPDHPHLGELELLVEAAENLRSAVYDVATDMQILQQTLTPLAERLMGKDCRNLLIPLWRRLSTSLQNLPYQAAQPELHLSYTASQAMDWDTTCQAVERESRWWSHSILLLRHARACDQSRRQNAALQSWFELCWQFPQHSDAVEFSSNYELRQQWICFLELEPELPVVSFPAWVLLDKPGLTEILPPPDSDHSSCPASYHTLYQLQHNHLHVITEHDQKHIIELRAKLKQQDPALFHHFLDRIGRSPKPV